MHLFINGLAASAGGGLTYLRNFLPEIAKRDGIRATVAVGESLQPEFRGLPHITCLSIPHTSGAMLRFWREQTTLGSLIEDSRAECLISAGNFALRNSPVPQILLSGNSLYTSQDFARDLRRRGEYLMLLDTLVKGIFAKRSLAWAECTVAPSEAFAHQLREWTGCRVRAIHHGFDDERFTGNQVPLMEDVQRRIEGTKDALRLLFVSHYNYYRNFETLFRSLPIIQKSLGARPVKLFLTCNLVSGKNPGSYRAEAAAVTVRKLGIAANVVELGAIPYEMLHGLYRSCHIYTTAAYTETFAHPLVEAMASGLPVVASDLPVHREVCGEAALYFDRFSPDELANQIISVASSEQVLRDLAGKGLARSKHFSWKRHVDEVLALAQQLLVERLPTVKDGCRGSRPSI